MPITPEEIIRRLRLARRRRWISQETDDEEIGREQSAISRIESGERPVSTLELFRLADLYGQPVEWFVDPNISFEQEVPDTAPFSTDPGRHVQAGLKGKQPPALRHLTSQQRLGSLGADGGFQCGDRHQYVLRQRFDLWLFW